MNPFSLQGKTVLITGASSGIGQQIAIEVSKAGGRVVLTGRDTDRLSHTQSLLEGQGHTALPFDLTIPAHIEALAEQVDTLDGFVHSAGITTHKPAKMIREQDISKVFEINFQTAVLLISQLLKRKKLKDGASIVLLSSAATRFTYYGGAMYTASKAALEAYCKVLAMEIAPKRMRANCLVPSFVETPMVEGAESVISGEVLEHYRKSAPLGFGETHDVAYPAVFLLSDAGRWMTGSTLVLGGIF